MKIIKKSISTMILSLCFPLGAFALPDGTLKRNTVVLDKEYRFYHWATKEKVSQISKSADLTSVTAKIYAKNVSKFASDREDRSFWSGFYLALDPLISANYGTRPNFDDHVRVSTNWSLTEVILPKGTRFLNIYTVNDSRGIYDGLLSTEEISWFRRLGCEASSVKGLSETACSRAMNAYLKEARIDGILYIWGRTSFSFCPGHKDPNQYAVIIKSPEIILKSKFSFFTRESLRRPELRTSLRLMNSFWKNNQIQESYGSGGAKTILESDSPFAFSDLPAVSKKEVREFARRSFLGCAHAIPVHQ